MKGSRLAWGGPRVSMTAGDGGREEFRAKPQDHLELKKKEKDPPTRKKVCCRAPPPQHIPFHRGNCRSSSKLLYSLPCTIRTSLPSKRTCSSTQSSPSALPPGEKAFWISGPESLKETMAASCLCCQVRVTNKSKPTGSTFEENWWEIEIPKLKKKSKQWRLDATEIRKKQKRIFKIYFTTSQVTVPMRKR